MKIILSNNAEKFYELRQSLENLSAKQRLTNAFKRFLMFFGLALLAIFIPVLHFFLVPLMLLVSLYMFKKTYDIKYVVKFSDNQLCFECSQPLKSEYQISDDLVLKCNVCGARYLVKE